MNAGKNVRPSPIAGAWYEGNPKALARIVDQYLDQAELPELPGEVIAVIAPHAGHKYSGPVAGSVLSAIKPKKTYVILGPNHTGLGETFGLDESDSWKTPLGEIRVDRKLADAIQKNCKFIKSDSISHAHEHSIEVQLPILQFLRHDFEIVPIVVSYADLNAYEEAGKAIAMAIKGLKIAGEVTIIASSDMTHYESQEEARKKGEGVWSYEVS